MTEEIDTAEQTKKDICKPRGEKWIAMLYLMGGRDELSRGIYWTEGAILEMLTG